MKITPEDIHYQMTQNQSAWIMGIDFDSFSAKNRTILPTCIDEAMDNYVCLWLDENLGVVVVEDDNACKSPPMVNGNTFQVSAFLRTGPDSFYWLLRQGKATRGAWEEEIDKFVSKHGPLEKPYYAYEPKFDGPVDDEELSNIIGGTINRYRNLVSSVCNLSKLQRQKRFFDYRARTRLSGYRKHLPELLRRQKGLCGICGKSLESTFRGIEVDHIRPIHLGGTDEIGNLRATHDSCNRSRTTEDYMNWEKQLPEDRSFPMYGFD